MTTLDPILNNKEANGDTSTLNAHEVARPMRRVPPESFSKTQVRELFKKASEDVHRASLLLKTSTGDTGPVIAAAMAGMMRNPQPINQYLSSTSGAKGGGILGDAPVSSTLSMGNNMNGLFTSLGLPQQPPPPLYSWQQGNLAANSPLTGSVGMSLQTGAPVVVANGMIDDKLMVLDVLINICKKMILVENTGRMIAEKKGRVEIDDSEISNPLVDASLRQLYSEAKNEIKRRIKKREKDIKQNKLEECDDNSTKDHIPDFIAMLKEKDRIHFNFTKSLIQFVFESEIPLSNGMVRDDEETLTIRDVLVREAGQSSETSPDQSSHDNRSKNGGESAALQRDSETLWEQILVDIIQGLYFADIRQNAVEGTILDAVSNRTQGDGMGNSKSNHFLQLLHDHVKIILSSKENTNLMKNIYGTLHVVQPLSPEAQLMKRVTGAVPDEMRQMVRYYPSLYHKAAETFFWKMFDEVTTLTAGGEETEDAKDIAVEVRSSFGGDANIKKVKMLQKQLFAVANLHPSLLNLLLVGSGTLGKSENVGAASALERYRERVIKPILDASPMAIRLAINLRTNTKEKKVSSLGQNFLTHFVDALCAALNSLFDVSGGDTGIFGDMLPIATKLLREELVQPLLQKFVKALEEYAHSVANYGGGCVDDDNDLNIDEEAAEGDGADTCGNVGSNLKFAHERKKSANFYKNLYLPIKTMLYNMDTGKSSDPNDTPTASAAGVTFTAFHRGTCCTMIFKLLRMVESLVEIEDNQIATAQVEAEKDMMLQARDGKHSVDSEKRRRTESGENIPNSNGKSFSMGNTMNNSSPKERYLQTFQRVLQQQVSKLSLGSTGEIKLKFTDDLLLALARNLFIEVMPAGLNSPLLMKIMHGPGDGRSPLDTHASALQAHTGRTLYQLSIPVVPLKKKKKKSNKKKDKSVAGESLADEESFCSPSEYKKVYFLAYVYNGALYARKTTPIDLCTSTKRPAGDDKDGDQGAKLSVNTNGSQPSQEESAKTKRRANKVLGAAGASTARAVQVAAAVANAYKDTDNGDGTNRAADSYVPFSLVDSLEKMLAGAWQA